MPASVIYVHTVCTCMHICTLKTVYIHYTQSEEEEAAHLGYISSQAVCTCLY